MDGNISAVFVAIFASSIPAVCAWLTSRKTHREVRTNHGVRAGERIERLGDDVALLNARFARLTVAFDDHAESDKNFQDRVEPFLTNGGK